MEMTTIVASGPVIIHDGKLLLDKDEKDDFYKFIGGKIKEGESFEERCIKRAKEEINAEIEIIKPLSPIVLWENPQTKEPMQIILIHYLSKLKNPDKINALPPIKEFKWIKISDIKSGKFSVAPNVKILIEKENLK